jgi:hypothetical protein
MRQATCAACQSAIPMSDSFDVAGRVLCHPCAEDFVESSRQAGQPVKGISRNVDRTVCVHCSADSGDAEWSLVAGRPACNKCTEFFRNRPFPTWLKLSFALFLCLAVAAFLYNWRFFIAYIEYRRGETAMSRGDIAAAAALLDASAKHVPEVPELAVLPNLINAQKAIAEDRNNDALALLQQSQRHAPADWSELFHSTRLQAEIGLAFDAHDYDAFLSKSQELANLAPDKLDSLTVLASAYACKFASTGNQEFRGKSLELLARIKKMDGADTDDYREYENRIEHRLATREIITQKEFARRFPNGWKPETNQ